MASRELIVLGTASQAPTRHRNHNGYLLRWNGDGFLFDPGEGTQRQMTFADVSMRAVSHVCITHFHGDHCLGLAGIVQRASLENLTRPLHVHYPASGEAYFERLRNASIYDDHASVFAHPITRAGGIDRGDDWMLSCAALDHRVDSFGYRVEMPARRGFVPERLEAAGLAGDIVGALRRDGRIEVQGRTITYEEMSESRAPVAFAFVMDTRLCDGARELAAGVDLLVCESTFLDRDRDLAEAYGHMTARQAAELARDSGAKRLVLTHFSQRYAPDGHEFLEEAATIFPDAIVAQDLLRVQLP